MQNKKQDNFENPTQYYSCKLYVDQLDKTEQYAILKEIIGIAIVDFDLFPEDSNYFSNHITINENTGEHNCRALRVCF